MKKYFLTGLVTLLPFTVTIWLAHFFLKILTGPFIGMTTFLVHKLPIASPQLIHVLSQILILIALFFLIWFFGFFARKYFFHQLIRLGDRIIAKIPLVSKIYKTSKEIVISLFGENEKAFQQVVLLPFPCEGSYCIGLISRTAPQTSGSTDPDLISVFIPTTPNPATGYMLICNKSELIYLKMGTEEAIKYVVSCGMIQPHEIQK